MTSLNAIRRALRWAARELDVRRPVCSNVSVLPWSATARISAGDRYYWVKVSPTYNSVVESSILAIALQKRLSAMPTLVSACRNMDALLIEHVPSQPGDIRFSDLAVSKNHVCTTLAEHKEILNLETLSVGSCVDKILASCRDDRSWWIDNDHAQALTKIISEKENKLAELDARLPGPNNIIHGDFHIQNIISSHAGHVFIDWADACYGSPIWDQATFEISRGQSTGAGSDFGGIFGTLAGMKEITDFLLTPFPIPGEKYSIKIPWLRNHVSRRAEVLIQSLTD